MKRRRKIPDYRCHGVPVLRDVCPGNVPVPCRTEDGSLWGVFDMPARLVARVEVAAKRVGQTFDDTLAAAVRNRIDEKEES